MERYAGADTVEVARDVDHMFGEELHEGILILRIVRQEPLFYLPDTA